MIFTIQNGFVSPPSTRRNRVLEAAGKTAVSVAVLCFCLPSLAADTVEQWGLGASNYELYLGARGLGVGPTDRRIFGETVIGMGIVEGASAYLAASASANEWFRERCTARK